MQSGSLSSAAVSQLKTRVLVNGVERPHVSWSDNREISGDLPAQVVAGSGITQATGTIGWATQGISETSKTPWNMKGGWRPLRGDRIEIWCGDGASEWRVFIGVVDKTTGQVGEDMQSTLIDDCDRFSARVTHEPLLNVMPPASGGGEFRGVGLTHTYFVDLAFRAAGFFVTPKQEPNCIFHVPGQGSIWPHRGRCVTAGVQEGSASYPTNSYAEWGFAISNAQATYLPEGDELTADDPVQLTMAVASGHAGFAYLRVGYQSTWIQLSVNNSRKVTISLGFDEVVSFTIPPGDDIIQALVKGYTFRIRSRSGMESSATRTFGGSATVSKITVGIDAGARVGGLQVSNPASSFDEFKSVSFQRNARISVSDVSLMGILRASPAIQTRSASELLDEISSATLSCLWINELGHAQWWPALAFRNRDSSRTLTTADDIFSLGWEESLLSSASRVSVRYKQHAVKLSKWPAVRVWQGSTNQLESRDEVEEFIEPGADEAWIQVSEDPIRLGGSTWDAYNRLRGSFVGVYYSSEGQTSSSAGLTTDITLSKLAPNKYLVRHKAGKFPDDVVANTATSPNHTLLWDNRRDKPLPDICAFAQVTWSAQTYSPTQAGGAGPELEHDVDLWVPVSKVPNVFDYLAGQTATPQPVVTGLSVNPDPRLQLGDVVTIRSEKFLGIQLTVLIVGMDRSGGPDGYSQDLTVKVLDAKALSQTYHEFGASMLGVAVSYAQFEASSPPAPVSYGKFNEH